MSHFRKYYTVKDIASILQLDPNTVYGYIETGKLACFNFGHAIRISPTQFKQFCEGNRRLVTTQVNLGSKGGNE